jgi:hypothetical protein
MSQSATPDDGIDIPTSPTDIMLTLICGVLSPLFLAGCQGIPEHGGMAAMEAMSSYGVRTQAELLIVSKIVAFGLAALDDLRLSMHPDVGLAQKIRLRAQANALNRSARQNEAALAAYRKLNPLTEPSIAEQLSQLDRQQDAVWAEQNAREEAETLAVLEETQRMVDAAEARARALMEQQSKPAKRARPAKTSRKPAHVHPAPATPEEARRFAWAAAMQRVAKELEDDMPDLSGPNRRANQLQISVLSGAASALRGGADLPPPFAMPTSGKPARR